MQKSKSNPLFNRKLLLFLCIFILVRPKFIYTSNATDSCINFFVFCNFLFNKLFRENNVQKKIPKNCHLNKHEWDAIGKRERERVQICNVNAIDWNINSSIENDWMTTVWVRAAATAEAVTATKILRWWRNHIQHYFVHSFIHS